ncbi:MAG: hypothetical protein AAF471_09075, partial [Myxococcota bacterium]
QVDAKEDSDHDEEDDNLYSQARYVSTGRGWFSQQGITRLFGTAQQTLRRQFPQTHMLGAHRQGAVVKAVSSDRNPKTLPVETRLIASLRRKYSTINNKFYLFN